MQKISIQFEKGDWPGALSLLQKELVDAVSINDVEKEAWIHLVGGICYQKWGRIQDATKLFKSAEHLYHSTKLRAELLLYKSKVASQVGDFGEAKNLLWEINSTPKILGALSEETQKTVLWRLGLACLMSDDFTNAKKLFLDHLTKIEPKGFKEANNILFYQVVSILCYEPMETILKSDVIDKTRACAKIYASSTVDTYDKLAHRGKCIIHTLIIESFYHWKINNKFTAFQQMLVGAEFLKRWGLTRHSEGVGEMLAIVKRYAPDLTETLEKSEIELPPHFILWIKSRKDSAVLLRAYRDAAVIANEAIESGDMLTIYNYWPPVIEHKLNNQKEDTSRSPKSEKTKTRVLTQPEKNLT